MNSPPDGSPRRFLRSNRSHFSIAVKNLRGPAPAAHAPQILWQVRAGWTALDRADAQLRKGAREIAPCFVEEGGRRTDTIVLACTHYPLLLDRLKRLAPWPVEWIDPAPAIARRVDALLGPDDGNPMPVEPRLIFTSGRQHPAAEALVRSFGTPAIA